MSVVGIGASLAAYCLSKHALGALTEVVDGHLPGVRNSELGVLTGLAAHVEEGLVVTVRGHGERAVIAASVLEPAGRTAVTVLSGGPPEWADATGLALESTA